MVLDSKFLKCQLNYFLAEVIVGCFLQPGEFSNSYIVYFLLVLDILFDDN